MEGGRDYNDVQKSVLLSILLNEVGDDQVVDCSACPSAKL